MKKDWIKVEYKGHVYTFEKNDKDRLYQLEAWYCEEINLGMHIDVEYSIEAKREELLFFLKNKNVRFRLK